MYFKYRDKIKFNKNTLIKTVLKSFNHTAVKTEMKGFGVVVNKQNKLIGVITEGDIRRILIKGASVNDSIENCINYKFTAIKDTFSYHKILRSFDKNILNLPIIDEKGHFIDLLNYSTFKETYFLNDQRIIRARCPVRISFAGGGTDFNEHINNTKSSVLTSSINKFCTASILVRKDNKINIISKDLNLKYSANSLSEIKMGGRLNLIKATLKIINPKFGFDLETYAEFSQGTGLGGSSAIVSAIIGAFNYFRNDKLYDLYEIADLAYHAERLETKISGGWQDYYACIFGGFNIINFNKDEIVVNPIKINRDTLLELEYNLMIFKFKGSRNSGKIQQENIKKLQKTKNKFNENSQVMMTLTNEMHKCLLKGELKKFGDLLKKSWEVKIKLNPTVTNKKINHLNEIAIKNGALGCKLLGAGQTGYLLVYASPLYQKKITKLLEKKDLIHDNFKFTSTGLEIWTTKR